MSFQQQQQKRSIGDSSFDAVGYGTMGLSAFYGKVGTDEERFKVLDAVYESGSTFWDTADIYGDSQELLGKWFKRTGKRDEIFLATKFGFVPDATAGVGVNGSAEYTRQAIETCLKTLDIETIDLVYLHRADEKVPIEITIAAIAEFVKSGKVKHIGLSEVSTKTLRRAHAVHPISALEVEYSPFTLDIEDPKVGLFEACRELGVKIVAYSPLGRGLLTGNITSPSQFEKGDFRLDIPRYSEENFPKILKLVEGLRSIGEKTGATAGQVALAWVLAQGDDIIPIPGTTKVKSLKENVEAGKLVLTKEDLDQVRKFANEANLGGFGGSDRYPPYMQQLFVDTPEL
ncbi:Aldo/keto reductase [Flagelloscypha sp. PMI_526]|nr:Aldo/keto reductase [Flagelloscypha sp. PMI_526]